MDHLVYVLEFSLSYLVFTVFMHLLNVVVFLCCVWTLVSDWSDVENSTSFVKVLVDLQQCSLCTYTGLGLLD